MGQEFRDSGQKKRQTSGKDIEIVLWSPKKREEHRPRNGETCESLTELTAMPLEPGEKSQGSKRLGRGPFSDHAGCAEL